ncbi:MAG TPA: hypothetical protein VJ385_03450 [Fibrobacteria bacterium]|nr:hypothetical protein [Fibrobacteria bacterium]
MGRYFWNTRYGGAGLRVNPDTRTFLDGIGLSPSPVWVTFSGLYA